VLAEQPKRPRGRPPKGSAPPALDPSKSEVFDHRSIALDPSKSEHLRVLDRIGLDASTADRFSSFRDASLYETIPIHDLNERYCFLDPNSGKKGIASGQARAAIIVIGVDSISRIFVLYAWADRVSTETMIDQLFHAWKVYSPRKVGVEADALQTLFVDSVKLLARFQAIKVPLVAVEHPKSVTKEFRIRAALQLPWGEKRLLIQSHQVELQKELFSFPNVITCDLVDALASAVTMAPPRRALRRDDAEARDLARYLRARGVAPSTIERAVASVHAGKPADRASWLAQRSVPPPDAS